MHGTATSMVTPPPMPSQHNDLPGWIRWGIGLFLALCISGASYLFGMAKSQVVTDQAQVRNEQRLKALEDNQSNFVTLRDFQQMRDDVSYLRNRIDQIYGAAVGVGGATEYTPYKGAPHAKVKRY